MGARLWYRSCPAVSQISNFTVVSSRHTDCARNAAGYKKRSVIDHYDVLNPPRPINRLIRSSPSSYLLWWSLGTHQTALWRNAAPGWTCPQPCPPAAPTWTGKSWSALVCRWSGLRSLWSSYWPETAGGLGLLPEVETGVFGHLCCFPNRPVSLTTSWPLF